MERGSERERSSRKSSKDHDRDRDTSKDHQRERDRDRERDQKQRHRHHHGSSKNSDERRHRGDDRRHHSRELSASDTEPDYDRRRERSSSRARDSVEREWPEERRYHSSHKRKEHGNEEDLDRSGKKARVSDGERRRFEDRASDDLNGDSKEEKRDEKPSRSRRREEIAKDRDEGRDDKRVRDEILSDGEEKRKPRKEARRFTDTVRVEKKEADNDDDQKEAKDEHRHKGRVKEETLESSKEEKVFTMNSKNRISDGPVDNYQPGNLASEKNSSTHSIVGQELLTLASKVSTNSASSHHSMPTKVSSFTTTNENEGVSIRSDEVHGKSSTDGTSTSITVKSGSLSLDALAKAKRALQMQKELSEKLKKIPVLNKVSSSTDKSQVSSDEDGIKFSLADAQPGPSSSFSATHAQTTPSVAVFAASENLSATGGVGILPGMTSIRNIEAVKRAQELAAKMGFRQDPEFAPLINMFPGQLPVDMTVSQKPAKAPVLRLDAQGREIDEHGNVINMPKLTNLSTLKVNINKQKKEAFQIIKPDLDAIAASDTHFDDRMGINKTKLLRPKRMSFQFVEEGKWSKQAEIIKFKSQFGEAQAKELRMKQTQLAKAKAEPESNPNLIAVGVRIKKEKQKDEIPGIEWWDKPILPSGSYVDDMEQKLNMDKITIYVEHPLPIEPPAEAAPPPPQPLKLTKKEQKKLRTQRRLAKERDRQEMIRQGLLEPPKPKVKMSNLMKVLGSEATQDPTKLEMEIRSAAAEREQAHVDRNIARKLTPAERREKKEKKLFDDPNSLETFVSVYKIKDLSHPQTRFKVDVNAQENRLTGCAAISDGITVLVVEGGKKPIKRYAKLMLKRINWATAVGNLDEGTEDEDGPVNSCVLVWQGSVAKPSFNRFLVHQCRSEAAAKKVFADAGVPHYWDLAVNFSEELL
ncbi:U4/U6 small nuclear ribonucleoprotein Prp3 isoform X1 [Canna indica]|uniref:U4/U6 small nuclear ribonucleoprotein Prp3 isoform X1 n=1 Tax=Canna indica TaxID=4628 RepID=A0AAQ3QBD3_9LILI|nr:U4/U6 small nuclear ribonucleoprotein Prp3 isoform X1 [Canna indica]